MHDRPTPTIAEVRTTTVLNSHSVWTADCEVILSDGRRGRGTAPRGETPSLHERDSLTGSARAVATESDLCGLPAIQRDVDQIIAGHAETWGRDRAYAMSVALFEALLTPPAELEGRGPGILFNLLNGGLHAYTNPIRADITEVLLVPRGPDLREAIDAYRRLLGATQAALADAPTTMVNGNRVHDLGDDGDDAALAFCTRLLADAGLDETFTLMVDASAGDWWVGDEYRLPVADRRLRSDQLVERWLDLMERHNLHLLEDPMAESDLHGWSELHRSRPEDRVLLSDNFTSTRVDELRAKHQLVDGVLIKPDQNGTVSGAMEFAAQARQLNLTRIASHRSIETDSPFLIHLAIECGVDWVKIGPYSDFSSILRTNALLRAMHR